MYDNIATNVITINVMLLVDDESISLESMLTGMDL